MDSTMASDPVGWQYRVHIQGDVWSDWQGCEKWKFEKIRDGLRSGWRSNVDFQVRELFAGPTFVIEQPRTLTAFEEALTRKALIDSGPQRGDLAEIPYLKGGLDGY